MSRKFNGDKDLRKPQIFTPFGKVVMKVARLVGGAGTGKTTELLRVMEGAKSALGGSPFSIGFTSFTRAARAEAVARAAAAWNVPPEILSDDGWFKTVHSICYRQLQVKKHEILDDSKDSAKWIADALGVSIRTVMDEDTGVHKFSADSADRSVAVALNCWQVARARMEPLAATLKRMARTGDVIPSFATCKQYIEKYEQAKALDGRFDFSDLLARFSGVRFTPEGVEECDPMGELPKGVKAWVMDEQQDASALVDRACRRLASSDQVQWVYLGGDPMQSIFGFGGSNSSYFMGWKVDKERVMQKTYRCPRPVLDLGERCLKLMRKGYWDRGIAPADHDGSVENGGYMESIASKLDPETSTLVVARCKFIVEKYEKSLIERRIPFMRLSEKQDTTPLRAARALWELEHGRPVTGDDFAAVMKCVPATGNFVRGAATAWSRETTVKFWSVVAPQKLEEAGLKPDCIKKITSGAWGELHSRFRRWRLSAERFGPEIASQPLIRTGTVHASKGMEADTVVLSTTVSRRIYEAQGYDQEQHDEERRVEYVGVTRARKRLILSTETDADYRMRIPR